MNFAKDLPSALACRTFSDLLGYQSTRMWLLVRANSVDRLPERHAMGAIHIDSAHEMYGYCHLPNECLQPVLELYELSWTYSNNALRF